jgi:hypothetical protein
LRQVTTLCDDVRELQRRLDVLDRPPGARFEPSAPRLAAASAPVAADDTPSDQATLHRVDHGSLEGRLLRLWNEVDWEHGAPSLSPIHQLLQDESYELVEGIVGIYALAVPLRAADASCPVFVLPILGKANALYDGSLFSRPQDGDSELVKGAAKLRFVGPAGARTVSLERLKAGHEKLSQVFTVVEPGRIE